MADPAAAEEHARLAAVAAARRLVLASEGALVDEVPLSSTRSASPVQSAAEPAHPSKLPLLARLLDARFPADRAQANPFVPRFLAGVNAVDRFRDAPPAVVVALFEQHMLLEPGSVGPLLYDDPVAREVLAAVNSGRLPPALLATVRKAGAVLYDGAAVVGVVDYRSWAFATHGTLPADNAQQSGHAKRPHEMHKVLLRAGSAGLSADIHSAPLSTLVKRRRAAALHLDDDDQVRMAFEARVIAATSPLLCLDPDPCVGHRLRAVHRALSLPRSSIRPAFLGLEPHSGNAAMPSPLAPQSTATPHGLAAAETVLRTLHADETTPTTHAERFVRKLLRPVAGASASLPGGAPANARFRVLHAAEDGSQARMSADATPHYGLDARKDPARLGLAAPPSSSAWLPPGQQLYRTLRFESRAVVSAQQPASVTHHTLHVAVGGVASPLTGGAVVPRFEARVRIGTVPCTNDAATPARSIAHGASPGPLVFATGSRFAIDAFVESFRTVMSAEGRQCVADVSNPAIAATVSTALGLGAGQMAMHAAASSAARPRPQAAQRPSMGGARPPPHGQQPFPRPR